MQTSIKGRKMELAKKLNSGRSSVAPFVSTVSRHSKDMQSNPGNEEEEEESTCLLPLKERNLRRVLSDAPVEMDEEEQQISGGGARANEVERVHCECCGMSEECTPSYISRIREFYGGRWVCGLCSEAAQEKKRKYSLSSIGAALDRHMALCKQFNTSIRPNPELSLAAAMRDFARKRSQCRAAKGSCSTKARRSLSCGPRLGVNK